MFQDEPDEPGSPGLFQDEISEDDSPHLFKAEPDERDASACASTGVVFGDEPDECETATGGQGVSKTSVTSFHALV